MASVGRRAARTAWVRHACLLAAVAVSVAGCVGMAQTGQVGTFGGKQADTVQNQGSGVGLFPTGPVPGSSPEGIVQQFLTASASYPTDVPIIQEYLAGSAKNWNPGWSVHVLTSFAYDDLGVQGTARHVSQRDLVEVSGPVQAEFNSSGQYVSASAQGRQTPEQYSFRLVKVDNQWRISNPPGKYRLISAYDFPHDYQAQDLYFFPVSESQSENQNPMLVPDSVFVPKGTPLTLLLRNLVSALGQGPGKTWLHGAAISGFPSGTKILDVVPYGATVTVNLGGAAVSASPRTLEDISAQLLWTLAGPSASVQTVQSVELELAGRPWTPPSSPCPGGQAPTTFQHLASYECYDPYPSAPASFSYVGAGQPWSRCGSESVAAQDHAIGAVVSVFGRTGSASSHQCGGYVDPQVPAQPPRAAPTAALSLVAVSPDGDYVAGVSSSPGPSSLYVGSAAGTATSFSALERLKDEQPGITAISWDRNDDLWAAQGVSIWVAPGSGTSAYRASNSFAGQVTDLAVAPDGVRLAAIVQGGAGNELELASVNPGGAGPAGVRGSPLVQFSIEPGIQLGPNLADPISLTWYNADTLIVLDAAITGNTLWSVPVDGEQATELPLTPPGTISITADGAANILVAGLSGNRLAFAASTAGPWEYPYLGGLSPAYP